MLTLSRKVNEIVLIRCGGKQLVITVKKKDRTHAYFSFRGHGHFLINGVKDEVSGNIALKVGEAFHVTAPNFTTSGLRIFKLEGQNILLHPNSSQNVSMGFDDPLKVYEVIRAEVELCKMGA